MKKSTVQINMYLELIEVIDKQNKMIADLVNENAEKENMINELMSEFVGECST